MFVELSGVCPVAVPFEFESIGQNVRKEAQPFDENLLILLIQSALLEKWSRNFRLREIPLNCGRFFMTVDWHNPEWNNVQNSHNDGNTAYSYFHLHGCVSGMRWHYADRTDAFYKFDYLHCSLCCAHMRSINHASRYSNCKMKYCKLEMDASRSGGRWDRVLYLVQHFFSRFQKLSAANLKL